VKDAVYVHDRESNCYPVVEQKPWRLNPIPVVSELRVGLVYRLGRAPVLSKYRYRRDADAVYNDSLRIRQLNAATAERDSNALQHEYDSLAARFYHLYDSVATSTGSETPQFDIRRLKDMPMPDEQPAKPRLTKEQKQAAAEERKARRAAEKQQKAAEKQQKAAEKKAKKQAEAEEKKSRKAAESDEKKSKQKGGRP
jgi:hypothetical protein